MAKRALSVYRAKRDFSKTAEPSGLNKAPLSPRLRFVIQKHAARRLHYDLRLELDGVFKSWAVTRGPSLDPKDKRLAVEVEDHPLDYGDFEGTIPKGEYGGGTVQLWDRGYWLPEGTQSPQQAFEGGDLKFMLDGARLHGSWVLVRMRGDRYGGKRTNWLLIKHQDADAKPGDSDGVLGDDRSVASGRTIAQITEGRGKRPTPFMLAAAPPGKADAVWHSKPARAAKLTKPAAARKPALLAKIPSFVEPQLAKLVDDPPQGPRWSHEVKLDGYRVQLNVAKGRVVIRTRTGLDWTERFAAIAEHAKALPDCVIDGEVVALDEHKLPSFAALQAALSDERSEALVLFAFDLLFSGREDLRALPQSERKHRLESLLNENSTDDRLRYVAHLVSNGQDVYASACKMGLEGIVSKLLDAAYRSGRSGNWVKSKCRAGQEVVLGGWTSEAGTVRSLLAGVYRNDALSYVGRIGTGYGREVAAMLLPDLRKLTRETSPFSGKDAPPQEKNVRWLKPTLVAEIQFAGWTATGMIRQAAFKGLRKDKAARDVVAEMPGAAPAPDEEAKAMGSKRIPAKKTPPAKAMVKQPSGAIVVLGVTISHPDKVLWPDAGDGKPVNKADLAGYFAGIGDWMMPHLVGRPSSLVRLPNGIGTEQFFQRHASAGMSPLLTAVKVKGDKAPYLQIDRIEALAAVAQIGTLEIHPWNCPPGNPEAAGRLIFDLDPAPDVAFDKVIEGAIEIRERLKAVGLECFCKTTGGKGLHVVTPLTVKNAVLWPVAKDFAHIICAQMAHDSPGKYLDNMSKSQRVGKIFLDYLRNDKTATAVAVLSPRARPGAPVSMPIDWKAVRRGLDPLQYTLRTAPALLRKSKPWAGYACSRPLAGIGHPSGHQGPLSVFTQQEGLMGPAALASCAASDARRRAVC